jgi:hypothetical protein
VEVGELSPEAAFDQDSCVPLPVGVSSKVTVLVDLKGFSKASWISICSGVEVVISIEPLPAGFLPDQL